MHLISYAWFIHNSTVIIPPDMSYRKFMGTGVAIITPFRRDDSIDFTALTKITEHIVSNEAEYIVVLGTTGETPTLSKDEKKAVVNCVTETVDKRVPVVVGLGGSNTQEIISKLKKSKLYDADAILSVCPYYNKPTQKGIYQHFKNIASFSPVPVIIYNVPSRTGVNIRAETTLKLATEVNKTFIGIKEASGNLGQIMNIINNKPDNFLVISGDDALTLPMISAGASGVISVIANAFPKEFSDMVRLALKNKFKEAREIHYKFLEIMEQLFIEGSPSGLKAAMSILGLAQNQVRLPLSPVSRTVYNRLAELIKAL
jgi:4-hydroxy-tetrahydrodipicolinate synthase